MGRLKVLLGSYGFVYYINALSIYSDSFRK
jgi:hypothetical protein